MRSCLHFHKLLLIDEIFSKIDFSMGRFTVDFPQFSSWRRYQNFSFRLPSGYLPSNPTFSRNFLILKFLSFASFGNSYIYFLQIIIQFFFTCGEEKLCQNSTNSTKAYKCFVQDCRRYVNILHKLNLGRSVFRALPNI